MREFIDLVECACDDDMEEIVIKTNRGKRLRELLSWIQDTAATGTGVTITAESNGGDKEEMYIDGDGPDKLEL
jgi:hypothetical protein